MYKLRELSTTSIHYGESPKNISLVNCIKSFEELKGRGATQEEEEMIRRERNIHIKFYDETGFPLDTSRDKNRYIFNEIYKGE